MYLSNEAGEHVYFDNFKVTHNRGRIIEENHYYAYGLCIQAISSRKLGEAAEGHLDNKYQFQGAFSEMDEDIGWNDFALRNYDPQVGRWVQQDPYQQFASPYVGMGGDPVNLIDPSGGFSMTGMAAGAVLGGMVGGVIDMVSGGSGGRGFLTGMAMGAAIGSGTGLGTMTNTVLQTANAVVQTMSQSGAAKQAGNVQVVNASNISQTSSGGTRWTGGYNRETMKWDDIFFNGVRYNVLSKEEIEKNLGQTGQDAETEFERLALAAFGYTKNETYRTAEGKVPESIPEVRLIDIFAKRKYTRDLGHDIVEAKLLNSKRALSSDPQQKSYVMDITRQKSHDYGVGSVWYITSGLTMIHPDLRIYATKQGVNLFQSAVYSNPNNPNVLYFSQYVGISGTLGAIKYNGMYGNGGMFSTSPFIATMPVKLKL